MCHFHPRGSLTRRSFVTVSSVAAATLVLRPEEIVAGSSVPAPGPMLDVARRAERWIRSLRLETEYGVAWPWDAGHPEVTASLYTGTAGVILFYLELYHATRDDSFLAEAVRGARELASGIPESGPVSPGLYTGLGGFGFCLGETAATSGDGVLRAAANRCFDLVVESARSVGGGLGWPTPGPEDQPVEITDIVSGAAGAGLSLLYAHHRLGHGTARETAVRAGERLIALGRRAEVGTRWAFFDGYNRWMPNFSHGTAGVAYFLAQLYHETGERRFLDAAVSGAEHLDSIAAAGPNSWRIMHHDPGGEDLFYLSWCHGPPGTARLYYSLAKTEADRGWMDKVHQGARGIVDTGIPEQRTPGFWNNISQCCGDAGVAEFFLQLQKDTGDRVYGEFLDRLVLNLTSWSTTVGDGTKWVQAENRVSPEELKAQTGFMQGAAGVGSLFLHIDAFQQGREPRIVLPDSPYTPM